jgi:hypothetical protein
MKLIKPTVITDAMFTSSTAPETDFPAWDAATAYVVGNKCIMVSTHRIYECLVANTNFSPDVNLTGSTPKWLDIAPTNKWAMMDNVVGTVTAVASPLTVVLSPGALSGLALIELTGKTATVTLKDAPAGATVYSATVSLDGTIITSFYDWFFTPYEQLDTVVLTDLPWQYFAPQLTVSITSTSGNVGCGVFKVGEVIDIGGTEYGATLGIIDYSKKTKDLFGNIKILEGAFSKRSSFKVQTDQANFNRIARVLVSVRAKPVIVIGSEVAGYEPLTIYCFVKDWSIDVAYPETNYCNLEIEGLV